MTVLLFSPTADLHVQLYQRRLRCHQLQPLSCRYAAVLWVRNLHVYLCSVMDKWRFCLNDNPFFVSLYSYSLLPQASCRSYFEQLADADFSVFSGALGYKRTALFNNARSCLVRPQTADIKLHLKWVSSQNIQCFILEYITKVFVCAVITPLEIIPSWYRNPSDETALFKKGYSFIRVVLVL